VAAGNALARPAARSLATVLTMVSGLPLSEVTLEPDASTVD
jgi:hypothetical protein